MPDFSQFFSSSPWGSWAGAGQAPQPAPQQQAVPPGMLDAIRRMLGVDEAQATTQPNAAGKVPSPDFTVPPPGLRPRPSDAFVPNLGTAKGLAAGLVEPFGQLGRVMTGQSQDPLADAVGAAAAMAPIGPPGAGKLVKRGIETALQDAPKAAGTLSDFITAYHGSPHDFDRFDLSKIGTGEGAQSYGHGLYFAENEGVAKSYKDILKGQNTNWDSPQEIAGHFLDQASGNRSIAANTLEGFRNRMGRAQQKKYNMDAMTDAKALLESGAEVKAPNQGRMYQVAIKAPPEHFLDWDKPLSEQSPKVQEAMEPFRAAMAKDRQTNNPGLGDVTHTGELIAGAHDQPALTKALREAGIPGIKYLDQGSRIDPAAAKADLDQARSALAAVEKQPADPQRDIRLAQLRDWHDKAEKAHAYAQNPTRNYVVFNDKLIDILKKYGIAGVGAIPAMNAYHYQDKGS